MALSDLVPTPHRITIYPPAAVTQDSSGGTVTAVGSSVSGIQCLITQHSGRRVNDFEQQGMRGRITISSDDARVIVPDTKIAITTGPREGFTFRVVSGDMHGEDTGFNIPTFYRATCEELTRTITGG